MTVLVFLLYAEPIQVLDLMIYGSFLCHQYSGFKLIDLSFQSIQRCMTYTHAYRQNKIHLLKGGKLVFREKHLKKHDFETVRNKAQKFEGWEFNIIYSRKAHFVLY